MMKNTSEKISKENHLHLSIDVKIPGTIVNVNRKSLQEALRILLQTNPKALTAHSPE
jgi:Na+/citrate or Na+/malate symporter